MSVPVCGSGFKSLPSNRSFKPRPHRHVRSVSSVPVSVSVSVSVSVPVPPPRHPPHRTPASVLSPCAMSMYSPPSRASAAAVRPVSVAVAVDVAVQGNALAHGHTQRALSGPSCSSSSCSPCVSPQPSSLSASVSSLSERLASSLSSCASTLSALSAYSSFSSSFSSSCSSSSSSDSAVPVCLETVNSKRASSQRDRYGGDGNIFDLSHKSHEHEDEDKGKDEEQSKVSFPSLSLPLFVHPSAPAPTATLRTRRVPFPAVVLPALKATRPSGAAASAESGSDPRAVRGVSRRQKNRSVDFLMPLLSPRHLKNCMKSPLHTVKETHTHTLIHTEKLATKEKNGKSVYKSVSDGERESTEPQASPAILPLCPSPCAPVRAALSESCIAGLCACVDCPVYSSLFSRVSEYQRQRYLMDPTVKNDPALMSPVKALRSAIRAAHTHSRLVKDLRMPLRTSLDSQADDVLRLQRAAVGQWSAAQRTDYEITPSSTPPTEQEQDSPYPNFY